MLEWITIYSSVKLHFHVRLIALNAFHNFVEGLENFFDNDVVIVLQVITNEESKHYVDQIMEKVSHA